MSEGRAYYNSGNYSAAVIQLKNVLLADPENGQARLLLGKTYLKLSDGLSAQKELKRALDLNVAREEVLKPLGRAWLMAGRSEKLLENIKVRDSDSLQLKVDILQLQGQAYLAKRQFSAADKKFSAALELQPTAAEALLGKARIAYQNQDRTSTANLVDSVLSYEPDNTDAWVLKGELLRGSDERQEALSAYQNALDIEPNNVSASLGVAAMLISLGELQDALVEIRRLQAKHPQLVLAHYLKALTLYQQQQLEPAMESIELALNQVPNHPPSHLLAGTISYQLHQLNRAEQHIRIFLNSTPDNLSATKLLAAILLKRKQPGKAIEVLNSQISDDPQYLALLGNAWLARGDAARGLEYLERAVEAAPDIAAIRTQLAIGQLAAGDNDKAVSELQTVIDLEQDLMQADVLLILTHLNNRAFDHALTATELLAVKMPDSPIPQNLKGVALLGKGELEAARTVFEAILDAQPEFLPAYSNLAQLELLTGNVSAAKSLYQKMLAYDAGNLSALLALAALADHDGRIHDTVQWLKQAYNNHPNDIKPALMLVEHYMNQDETKRALGVARQITTIHPRNPAALHTLSLAQIKAGENKEAAVTLKTLADVIPQSPQVRFELALVQMKQMDTDSARSNLRQAIKLKPDYPAAQLVLGRLYITEKNFDATLHIAGVLKQKHPNATYGYELEGDVYFARHDYKKAGDAYEHAYDNSPSAHLAQQIYHSRMQSGGYKAAHEILRQWLASHPKDIPVRTLLAAGTQSAGQHKQAIQEYSKILELDPDNVMALINMAWLQLEQGNKSSVEYAERAYELLPRQPEVIDTLGWLLVQNGQTLRGLRLLQEAAILAPHLPGIRYHMVVALDRSGHPDEARKELDRLLKTGKTFPDQEKARALRKRLGN